MGYDPGTYGDHMAEVYDEWFGLPSDTEDAVGLLSDLAGRGPALELGVGTGRIAIPLSQRGHRVYGIDDSGAVRSVEREARFGLQAIDTVNRIRFAGSYFTGAPIAW